MRRLLTCVTTLATALAAATTSLAVSTPAGQAAVPLDSPRATRGEVGAFVFADGGGAAGGTCVYSRGRLSAIRLTAPRASGRPQWEPTGQYVLWGARLQARTGRGAWRYVGGTHYSEPIVAHAGTPQRLRGASVPRVLGAPDTRYRVVETINWYFNDRNEAVVQGQATDTVSRLASPQGRVTSCPGVMGTRLPPVKALRLDELDPVRVSFRGATHGARVRYSVQGGTLPRGLRLGRRTGMVSGTVSAGATDLTTSYRDIRSRTFAFRIAASANGQTTSRTYRWTVFDTAFVMQDYYGRYGCGDECGEPVRNISDLGPKLAFGCSDLPQQGIPEDRTGVIYRQDYQLQDGSLARSAGRTFRYGDIFKWWYYPCSG